MTKADLSGPALLVDLDANRRKLADYWYLAEQN
jgi:hypothetical protein